uniref:Keratinocyte differentiation associated protein n=1 Tax=Equus caballus TaxID=9796 RepID=F6RTK7_HORSE
EIQVKWGTVHTSRSQSPRCGQQDLGEETTLGNYAAGPEAFNTQFLNLDKLRSAFKTDEFLNWHALFESIKKKLPFLNWDAFPKLKGLRSATPDAQ